MHHRIMFLTVLGLVCSACSSDSTMTTHQASSTATMGVIEGRVRFEGVLPGPQQPVDTGHFAHVCGHGEPVVGQELRVGQEGGLANAVIVLKVPASSGSGVVKESHLDQRNCTFVPHVQTVTLGSSLKIGNNDPLLHNVHGRIDHQTVFNLAMPVPGVIVERTLSAPGIVQIGCDSGHTWMSAYIVVVAHGFHAVTDLDGRFRMTDVPPGTHEVWVWHERLGLSSATVQVEAGGEARLDLTLREPVDPVQATVDTERLSRELVNLAPVSPNADSPPDEERRATLARGRATYFKHCVACHGQEGRGDGPTAIASATPPRDFTLGVYKLRSTPSGSPPLLEDVFRTVSLGMPGTLMPAWGKVLTADERWEVATYVMSLSKPRGSAVAIPAPPPEPPDDVGSVERGRKLYATYGCGSCHGESGQGDGPAAATLKDIWGNRIPPANLARGTFKGGQGASVVYRTIMTGLSGTPMPSFSDVLSPMEAWDLAHYVLSLAQDSVDGAAAPPASP